MQTQFQDYQLNYQWSQLIARAWDDDSFKRSLLANPAAVLKENGFPLGNEIQVKVLENNDKLERKGNVLTLPLPPKPGPEEFAEEEISFSAHSPNACHSLCNTNSSCSNNTTC